MRETRLTAHPAGRTAASQVDDAGGAPTDFKPRIAALARIDERVLIVARGLERRYVARTHAVGAGVMVRPSLRSLRLERIGEHTRRNLTQFVIVTGI